MVRTLRTTVFLRRLRPLAALLVVCLMSGCAVMHKQFGAPVLREAGDFEDGSTRVGDVMAALGPPSNLSALDDGYVFVYESSVIEERQLGVSIDYQWLRIFKFVVGRGWADRETQVFVFDGEGLMRAHEGYAWRMELGGGSSVQPVIAVMSVVETSEAETSPPAHGWGAALLQARLQEALNRDSSPRTGQAGVEQDGTPTGAGQRTLEFLRFPLHLKTTGRR